MREGIGVWEGGEEEDEERHREMGGEEGCKQVWVSVL